MKILIEFEATAQVSWRVIPSKDGGWVAICDALKLTAEGETHDEVHEACSEIVQHLLTSLLKEGRLDKFLKEHGWKPVKPVPKSVPKGGVHWDIPMQIQRDRLQAERRAYA